MRRIRLFVSSSLVGFVLTGWSSWTRAAAIGELAAAARKEGSLVLHARNTKLVPVKDVPRAWEDIVDPKWKDSKLGVADSTHNFTLLAAPDHVVRQKLSTT